MSVYRRTCGAENSGVEGTILKKTPKQWTLCLLFPETHSEVLVDSVGQRPPLGFNPVETSAPVNSRKPHGPERPWNVG